MLADHAGISGRPFGAGREGALRLWLNACLHGPLLLALPAIVFVGIFAVWPMAQFLFDSLRDGQSFSLIQFQRLLASSTFFVVLGKTLVTAITVTLCCLVLAYPMAYALMRIPGRLKSVMIGLVALPYLTSVIVRTYAWAAILALRGPVNEMLLGLGLLSEPLLLGHSDFGTMIGMIHILLPIAVLTLWSGMEKIDAQQRTAAASLGASRIEEFLTVTLPQSLPGLGSAASLVYILSLGAYVIPQTLGGTRGLLFAQMLVDQATTLLNWNLAAAMAVIMLVAAAVPAMFLALAGRVRLRGHTHHAIGPVQSLLSQSLFPILERVPERFWTWAWRISAGLVLAFLILPELVIIAFSFGPERDISFPPAYFTLQGYIHTLSDPSWMQPLQRSVVYAAIDALLATALGALAAYGFARSRPRWGQAGTALLVIPIVLPEIVIAISYFIFANRIGLSGSAAGVILGQGAAAVGLVVVILSGVVRQLDENIEYAALMCGASRLRTVREIVLPMIAPGLLVGFVYGFLHAFDNLVLPLFITGQKPTVTVRMFLSLQEELTSAPAVIASILIAVLVIGLTVALALARRNGGFGLPLSAADLRKD
ncbi:ABC transporter permease subunit [Martelella mediterranea]|uniref:ABC transporter permease subunit n=1 Tax=Martelella mediterranea TaxID=293089 RepID=UPI001E381256|nr:ABC transporter permease subunit [Martelella mediterranea]MCD1635814.1 ABC transporter permease subunit [Martelella mediterranea]